MSVEKIKEIVEIVKQYDLAELHYESQDFKLRLKRSFDDRRQLVSESSPMHTPFLQPIPGDINVCPLPIKVNDEEGVYYVKSPMVGTFYVASTPDAPPFINVGDVVQHDTVVCILEAMKVMNEVHAECDGEVVEILGRNGCPVEYGQALFKIRLKDA